MDTIKGAIQGLDLPCAELMGGEVVSVSPVKVSIINDDKVTFGGNSLRIPAEFGKRTLSMTIGGVVQEVEIDDSLKLGERVYLLYIRKGRKYVVMGRM